jgi:formylglycine-generating enzyme required for sulfatase activity
LDAKRRALIAALGMSLAAAAGGAVPAAAPEGELVDIPGGSFVMGDARGEPDEAPRRVTVAPFRLMRYEVTNRRFGTFVTTSGYPIEGRRSGYVWDGEWRLVDGADWRHPQGPESSIAATADHPVVQVSARDAEAFCSWHGLRLPTEEEWEFAARGTDGRRHPWGDGPPQADGRRRANFGTLRCCAADSADGYLLTAPVGRFPSGASPFGLFDMAGNVWEWTASPFPGRPKLRVLRGGGWGNNPNCLRSAYRHGNPPDIGLDMVGFRCAGDVRR